MKKLTLISLFGGVIAIAAYGIYSLIKNDHGKEVTKTNSEETGNPFEKESKEAGSEAGEGIDTKKN